METTQETLTQLLIQEISASRQSIEEQWANPIGTRTRYFFIDDLLPLKICQEIYDAFPRDGNGFFNRDSFREKKKKKPQQNKTQTTKTKQKKPTHTKTTKKRISYPKSLDLPRSNRTPNYM